MQGGISTVREEGEGTVVKRDCGNPKVDSGIRLAFRTHKKKGGRKGCQGRAEVKDEMLLGKLKETRQWVMSLTLRSFWGEKSIKAT